MLTGTNQQQKQLWDLNANVNDNRNDMKQKTTGA